MFLRPSNVVIDHPDQLQAYLFEHGRPGRLLEIEEEFLDRVRAMFDYDPGTGELSYTFKPPSDARATKRIGLEARGRVKLYDYVVASANLVWLLHKGRWPVGRLRRRNDQPADDRIENLYEPRSEPLTKGTRPNRAKSRGVARCGEHHWQAYAREGGAQKNLGRFETEAKAIAARAAWDAGVDLV